MPEPKRAYTREKCPYDGTVLYNGEACEQCERDIAQHMSTCRRCAGDWDDLRKRDAGAQQ